MSIKDLLKKYTNETVILVDLSWALYSSYYAFRNLSNSQGEPTGQYFGIANKLIRITDSYPNALVLLVDDGCPVERKELNESYKGNREHSVYFKDKKHIIDCLIQYLPNVYRVYNSVVEADDLLFSISRIKDFNNKFIIYTTDKDLYQSIDDTTKVTSELKKTGFILKDQYHETYIKSFQDLAPYQLPFYRAVLGDPSDNLKIIRPRFPSKVAYYFAKNYITKDGHVTKPSTKPDDLTDKQYENLLEIYASTEFINNLKLMKLNYIDEIPVMPKVKQSTDVQEILNHFELNQFKNWLKSYLTPIQTW